METVDRERSERKVRRGKMKKTMLAAITNFTSDKRDAKRRTKNNNIVYKSTGRRNYLKLIHT